MHINKTTLRFCIAIGLALAVSTSTLAQGIPGSGWWSGEQVQNVGPDPADFTVTAYDSASSSTYTASSTGVASGASVVYLPASFSGMPDGFLGSAIISSDQPIKAITNVTNQLSGSYGVSGGKAAAQYQGSEATDTTLYFPNAKNNRYGQTTAFYIQNAGSGAATATATFNMDNGSTYPFTTPSIGPGKMVVVLPSDAGVPSSPSDGTRVNIGSMSIISTEPLAGTVLEFKVGEVVATVLKGTRSFTSADFDSKAYAPVTKNMRYNRFTGIQVMNVTGGPIDVTVTYKGTANVVGCKDVVFVDTALAVPAGKSKTFVQLTGQTNLIANCTAAATITATGDFVAIVNEDNSGGTTAGITYSARPDADATAKISAPIFKDQRFGFTTGLQIQNVGLVTATNVVATFVCKGNNGANTPFTAISNPQTIVSGAAFLFYRPSSMPGGTFTVGNPFSMSGANCGVTITSDQPVVAILNETPDSVGALDDNNYEGFNLVP
jgi:hypothetical protein